MATARLIPSKCTRSNNNYVTFSDSSHPESNLYANTDSTTYATIRGRNRSSNTYYFFLHGFNFSAIPANAVVSAFSVKINAYRASAQQTGATYRARLVSSPSNSSVIADTTLTSDFDTSAATYTFPNGDLKWSDITGYGDNFGIELILRPSSNTYPYYYVYGAEIEVTYTEPQKYNITTTNNTAGTVTPSGTVEVTEGGSHTVTISGLSVKPTVTDNNVDVTSQLVQMTNGTQNLVPESASGSSGFTVQNEANGYHGADNSTYASMELAGGSTTGNIYFEFPALNLPSGSTINSISCAATFQYNRNGSSSGYTASCQLYAGSTAKGSSTSLVTAGGTDVAKTTFNLTAGSWTASDLADAKLRITATNNASSTHRFLYFYGATLTVTYTISGTVYTYTITNIRAAHTIVVNNGSAIPPVITVGTPNVSTISAVTGHDQCVCTFVSDIALQQWEARATKAGTTPARGVGLLVESGGALAANTPATIYVENEELTNGDGVYTITVYGQSTGGVWSDG